MFNVQYKLKLRLVSKVSKFLIYIDFHDALVIAMCTVTFM